MRRRGWISDAPVRVGAALLITSLLALSRPALAATSCPDSFESDSIPSLIDSIKAAGDGGGEAGFNAGCASKVLARKGEDIIPALISLMETHQRGVEVAALDAVCNPPAHTGATAVPYIEQRLREGGQAFAQAAYPTLACVGEGAASTIPLLMSKSLSINLSFPAEADLAIETLSALYRYDPRRILPHLTRLLDQPAHTLAAARALEKLGHSAQSSQIALQRNLEAAIDSSQDDEAVALIAALGSVGSPQPTVAALVPVLDLYRPRLTAAAARALVRFGSQAASAVPGLLRRFNSADASDAERTDDVRALLAIDKDAPEFAQALVAALGTRDQDSGLRPILQQALAQTHSDLKPETVPRPAPVDVSDRLAGALWSLTQQPQPIVLDDLVRTLHIDPNDYVNDGRTADVALTRKWSPPEESPAGNPVRTVRLTSVIQAADPPSGQPRPPATQLLELGLDKGTCVSAAGMRGQQVSGDPSAPRSSARSSQLNVGAACTATVSITKIFDPEYWSFVCPFSYDRAFIDARIIPALQREFGDQFGTYNLDSPAIKDSGPRLQLTYSETRPEPPRKPWQAMRISLEVDRCTRGIANLVRFIP